MLLIAIVNKAYKNFIRGGGLFFVVGRMITNISIFLAASFVFIYLFDSQAGKSFAMKYGSDFYIQFIFCGILVFSFMHGLIVNISRAILTEEREETLNTLLISSFSFIKYFGSLLIFQILLFISEFFIYFIIGLFFGLKFDPSLLIKSPLIIVSLISCGSLCIFIGSIMYRFNDTFIIQNLLFYLIVLFSGGFFDINIFPYYVRSICYILPTTWLLFLLHGDTTYNSLTVFCVILVLTIAYVLLGIFVFNKFQRIRK